MQALNFLLAVFDVVDKGRQLITIKMVLHHPALARLEVDHSEGFQAGGGINQIPIGFVVVTCVRVMLVISA